MTGLPNKVYGKMFTELIAQSAQIVTKVASSGEVKPYMVTVTVVAVLANIIFIPMFWLSLRRFLTTQDQVKDQVKAQYDELLEKFTTIDKGFSLNIQSINDSVKSAHKRLDRHDDYIRSCRKKNGVN